MCATYRVETASMRADCGTIVEMTVSKVAYQ